MQIQQLLASLQHGYTYQVDTDEGPKTVQRPPNTHMLTAAKIIVELYQQVEQRDTIIQNLSIQIQKLLKDDNEILQAQANQHSDEGKPASSTKSPTDNAD
jgi:hypothetical protein